MLAATVLALATAALAHKGHSVAPKVPSLRVPACPAVGTATFSKSVPDLAPFPTTSVALCYSASTIEFTFTAQNETNFFFNETYTTNGNIWEYEVMEAFVYKGTNDPATYLEIEVAPNNVTFQSFVYNPSKVRTPGTPFDHAFISDPIGDGLVATTTLDKAASKWTSTFSLPLALFSVDAGTAKGTKWRMNFFRTVVSPATFPDQFLGAWNPPDEASFHKTPFFGNVLFV
ncbi:hypothetical protein EXIGLDRAFT_723697 [Exidia glandulosa HHB12029]|uniref:Carbohydrate-binding domain-containing protein n=1 Tax=Exidia glandulosa HHB12029 TaxID=1314781 RepID=A0A166A0P3_EXIGL|nr:hypothetical protein EXIGLDRAFT_723697 [Exidia glandulosa HHB12029]